MMRCGSRVLSKNIAFRKPTPGVHDSSHKSAMKSSSISNGPSALGSSAGHWVWMAVVLLSCCAAAQNPQVHPRDQKIPTVTFTLANWRANPSYYSIAIGSAGDATYQSAPDSLQRTGVPYSVEFQATRATRDRIFALVEKLNRLQGISGTEARTAEKSSIKTLTYRYADVSHSVSYHKAPNKGIEQLTVLFQRISATLEFGRRLNYLAQYDPQGLRAELKRLQAKAKRGSLLETQALAPVLKAISSNGRLSPTVRQTANALVAKYGGAVS